MDPAPAPPTDHDQHPVPPADPAAEAAVDTAAQPADPDGHHAIVLHRLLHLTREHLLRYRLGVGRLILDSYFHGDPARFASRDRTKERSFAAFLMWAGPQLAEIGLGDQTLRACVRAAIVAQALSDGHLDHLTFRHLVALYRLPDPDARAALAGVAVEQAWSVRTLEDATQRVLAGAWHDAEPAPPDGPMPTPPHRPPTSRQVAARIDRAAAGVEAIAVGWSTLADAPDADRARAREALARMKAMVEHLEAALR